MNSTYLRFHIKRLKDFLAVKTEMVNHRAVIKEVASSVERSWVYYSMLLSASLIALLGLLTNSVAVVIGAMLISPLMGPIISSGLAFTIGDLHLARRAFKTIAVSVMLTIVVCTIISFISPLKEPTAEILARVRPNIFDLFVAVLSGIVGAIALCTKRDYLITASGVAIATAVIPPLSVIGYGLGTGQLMLALGGFLLFFTNFVAIVLTSDLVFFILGFRTSHLETVQYSPRKRFLIIASLLTLISIPLVYTLVVDITMVKEKKRIERVLKQHLNKDLVSRMTGYDYLRRDEKLLIRASINTVQFVDKQAELGMEQELTDACKRPVDVHLEQVIVASEKALHQPGDSELIAGGSSASPRIETTAQVKGRVDQIVINVQRELAQALAPFPVSDTRITFASDTQPLQVSTTLKRDYPMEDEGVLLLARILERSLGTPVVLTVNTVPLLPSLDFDDAGALTSASATSLELIKQLPGGSGAFRFVLESSKKNEKKQGILKNFLVQNLKVPEGAVMMRFTNAPTAADGVALRITRQ